MQLSEWTLRYYIDAGQELGWVSRSTKGTAGVLRDYRNYIHPEKQRSHNVALSTYGLLDVLGNLEESYPTAPEIGCEPLLLVAADLRLSFR